MVLPEKPQPPVRIRDAASLVLIDRGGSEPRVLMGRRHARMAFVPDAFVFPGGKLDPDDFKAQPATSFRPDVHAHMQQSAATRTKAEALATAAIRETYEETGIWLAGPGDVGDVRSETWTHFRKAGLAPRLDAVHMAARAITPVGSPIRFHARFFVADAGESHGELRGSGELEELGWYTLREALKLPVIDVTEFVLGEAAAGRFDRPRAHIPLFSYRNGRPFIRP
ncbi:MAG: NUDIX domain-containing protein [Rhizobiales bacterium]|nr:NUDIX domain-containing protein [Hyphomicrobiales bacterium]